MELSKFGQDYGAAVCLAPDRAALPRDQLTPAEAACVTRVGLGVETRLVERLGAPSAPPPVARYAVTGPQGQPCGSITFAGGAVNWCVPREAPNCGPLGYGHDGLHAALRMLDLLGFDATEMG